MARRTISSPTHPSDQTEPDSKGPNIKRAEGPSPSRPLAPGLYVTATPIGNASDVTLRALAVLKGADAIVAEDTRVTSRLLSIHGISRPMLAYNDHNAPKMRPQIIERLKRGAVLALVSDAGTPLISDPGHKLVRAVREEGLAVFPVPGASAAIAALSAAGLPTDRFFFAGFLPSRSGERKHALEPLAGIPGTLVFYESPQRLADTLADMAETLGSRAACVAREITKLHEEFSTGTLPELAARFAGAEVKGEITILVAQAEDDAPPDMRALDELLKEALAFMPVKAASSLIAKATGVRPRLLYDRALLLKEGGDAK